jgi:hypothetical protein
MTYCVAYLEGGSSAQTRGPRTVSDPTGGIRPPQEHGNSHL